MWTHLPTAPVMHAIMNSCLLAEFHFSFRVTEAFLLKYPPLAKRNRIQGQCIISFQLNGDGTMQDMRIVKQLGGGTGEEALRVVRLLKFKSPELPIRASLPIVFKLGMTGSNALDAQ